MRKSWYYVNVFEHKGKQFHGAAHSCLGYAQTAAESELAVEPDTRLIARLKVYPKTLKGAYQQINNHVGSW